MTNDSHLFQLSVYGVHLTHDDHGLSPTNIDSIYYSTASICFVHFYFVKVNSRERDVNWLKKKITAKQDDKSLHGECVENRNEWMNQWRLNEMYHLLDTYNFEKTKLRQFTKYNLQHISIYAGHILKFLYAQIRAVRTHTPIDLILAKRLHSNTANSADTLWLVQMDAHLVESTAPVTPCK